MTAMNTHLRINVIVDVRGMNVNTHVGADLIDGLLYAWRQRRSVMSAWGSAPGFMV
ncbi:MAG TPA: hypothetical protein VK208_00940 [Pyrinomonadaceae bacterium]|nr:hypothetical protein [Pyrinomonadaceae bacterium]